MGVASLAKQGDFLASL